MPLPANAIETPGSILEAALQIPLVSATGTPSTAALSDSGRAALIASLQSQVAQLTAELQSLVAARSSQPSASAVVAASASQPVFAHALAPGSSGSDVINLQNFLSQKGYFSGTATGYFGPLTVTAVAQYQEANGLESLGAVGPKTLALLNAPSSASASSSAPLPPAASQSAAPSQPAAAIPISEDGSAFNRPLALGSAGADVSALQTYLKSKGLFSGDLTGYYGPLTEKAVAQFQQANGLEAVGTVGPKTRAQLRAMMQASISQASGAQSNSDTARPEAPVQSSDAPAPIPQVQNVPPVQSVQPAAPSFGGGTFASAPLYGGGGGYVPPAPPTPAAPTLAFSASTSTIDVGSSFVLAWNAANANSCAASGDWNGNLLTSGSTTISSSATSKTYSLTCTGPGGSVTQSAAVAVAQTPAPALPPSVVFAASSSTVQYAGSPTVTWSSQNATACAASGAWNGVKATSGSQSLNGITATSTYSLTCTGPGGAATQSVSINVFPAPLPSVTLTPSASTVPYGGALAVTWTSLYATGCNASGAWAGTRGPNGSQSLGTLVATSTYSILCVGPGGSASRSFTIAPAGSVPDTMPPSIPANLAASAASSSQITLSWSPATDNVAVAGYQIIRNGVQVATAAATSYADKGLAPATAYSYAIKAYDASGNVSTSSSAVNATTLPLAVPSPALSLVTSASSVAYGGAATITWNATNATACTASGSWSGAKAPSGSLALTNLTANQAYVLACSGAGGSVSQSVAIAVAGQAPDASPPSAPVLAASASLQAQIDLSWSAASDNVGVAGYKLYRNGVQFATTTLTAYSDTGLAPATAYSYAIKAYDAAGNVSTASNAASATTLAYSTSPSPSAFTVTSPIAGATVSGTIPLTGIAGSQWANVAVYGPTGTKPGPDAPPANGTYATTINTTQFQNGPVTLSVIAFSLVAGQIGGTTKKIDLPLVIANAPDTQAPSAPGNLSAAAITASQINLSWSAATDNYAVAGYKVFRNGLQVGTSTTLSYEDSALVQSLQYSYMVKAFDFAGNVSSASNIATATASPPPPIAAVNAGPLPALPQWKIAPITPVSDASNNVTINLSSQSVQIAPPGVVINVQSNLVASQPLPENDTYTLYVVDANNVTVATIPYSLTGNNVTDPTMSWSGPTSFLTQVKVPSVPDGTYYVMAKLSSSAGTVRLKPGASVTEDPSYRYYIGAIKVQASASRPSFLAAPSLDLTGYHLTFDDEFTKLSVSDATTYDGSNWYTHNDQCCMMTTDGAGTAMVGVNDPYNTYTLVPGGGLNIRLQKNNNRWTSGVMTSVDNHGKGFSQQYGYFEMKAKLPSGIDTWPGFWMLDEGNRLSYSDPHLGEIDIMEYIANPAFLSVFTSTVHDWANHTTPAATINYVTPPSDGNYHTFGMLWTPQTTTFYYDGSVTFTIPTPATMHQPYFMLVDLGIGSGWPTEQTPAVNDMQVAYVRAYSNSSVSSSLTNGSNLQLAASASALQNLGALEQRLRSALQYLRSL